MTVYYRDVRRKDRLFNQRQPVYSARADDKGCSSLEVVRPKSVVISAAEKHQGGWHLGTRPPQTETPATDRLGCALGQQALGSLFHDETVSAGCAGSIKCALTWFICSQALLLAFWLETKDQQSIDQ